jgi:hypothetical protein
MGQFRQVSALRGAVVSARIQHRPFEGNDGFRPVRARPPWQVHRRYIFALTCKNPVFQDTRRAGRGARMARTRAGRSGNAEIPGPAAVVPTRRRHGAGRAVVTARKGFDPLHAARWAAADGKLMPLRPGESARWQVELRETPSRPARLDIEVACRADDGSRWILVLPIDVPHDPTKTVW